MRAFILDILKCDPLKLISDQHLDQPVYLRLHEQRFQKSFPHVTQNEGHGPEPSSTGQW